MAWVIRTETRTVDVEVCDICREDFIPIERCESLYFDVDKNERLTVRRECLKAAIKSAVLEANKKYLSTEVIGDGI